LTFDISGIFSTFLERGRHLAVALGALSDRRGRRPYASRPGLADAGGKTLGARTGGGHDVSAGRFIAEKRMSA